ncbi:hypothetical protein EST38_g8664 [Candolleomyces aberdarensis]|uniref:Uncharacterized protein n=1 Tax=Candolleomyces aberdarensis TaxID=2316362 RepID=A0A4Q2DC32_9AGAR|nr:hypothetical protein EST38_g8664 [Candolleomyces aberdarensis]
MFSFSLWQSFASKCKKPLACPGLLSFSCGISSPAPFIFNPVFQLMKNVQTLTATNADPYANPSFIEVAGSDGFFPKLNSLGFPLNRNSIDLAYIPHLLRQRRSIERVSFCVSPAWVDWMGLGSQDALQSVIEELAVDFPESVELDWFEL